MNRFAPIALAATAVVVAVLIGIGLIFRSPNVGPPPVPGPTATIQPAAAAIAFIQPVAYGRGAVWVANLEGTGAHLLVPDQVGDQEAPAWSPDGTHLVFSWDLKTDGLGYPSGESRLYMTDRAGSAPQLVETGCVRPCVGDSEAAFSSDGTRLVFVRTLIVPPPSTSPAPGTGGKVPGDISVSVLATIDLSTGHVVELVSTTSGTLHNRHPHWSPDGARIVSTEDIPQDINGPMINGWPAPAAPSALFVVDADGANFHEISPNGAFGSWSPDGGRIVFSAWSSGVPVPNAGGTGYTVAQYSDIYTSQPDGTDLRQLTSDRFSQMASWTANGRIWFVRTATDDGGQPIMGPGQVYLLHLWVMDSDGGNATQLSLSQLPPGAWPVPWSPTQ
jgi:Tol biopolymer transport system component